MSKIEDFASLHHSDSDSDNEVALARIVRTVEGSHRFRSAIGAIIQDKPRIAGDVAPSRSSADITVQVAQLRKALAKLDKNAVEGILKQMEESDFPHNKRYDMVKTMLEEFLKERLKQPVEAAKHAARNAARNAKDKATGQG